MNSELDIDSFPCILENPSDFRKGSGDYGVTLAVQVKHVDQIQPLMAKAQKPFAAFLVPCGTLDQAETFIKSQQETHTPLIPPLPRGDMGGGSSDGFSTVEQMSIALACDPRTVQNYADAGLLVRNTRGQYDLLASLASMNKARKDAETAQGDALRAERVLQVKIGRQKKEVELQEKLGTLVNAAEVRALVEKANGENRHRWMALPKYLAPKLDGMSVQEMEVLLEDYVRVSLTQLASLDLGGIAGAAGVPDHGAAAEAHREPVGGRKKDTQRAKRR